MNSVIEIFQELGRRLNMGPILFQPPGPLTITADNLGQLSFETTQAENLLISLAWDLASYDRVTLLEAFKSAAPEKAGALVLKVGFYRDQIILMSDIPVAKIGAPQLESLILRLFKLAETLKALGQ